MYLNCVIFYNNEVPDILTGNKHCKQYNSFCLLPFQRFPLGGDDEVMTSTLQQFAKVIDEVSACMCFANAVRYRLQLPNYFFLKPGSTEMAFICQQSKINCILQHLFKVMQL